MQRIQLHGSGTPDFSNSSKTRAKPSTSYILDYMVTWLSSFGRGVPFGGFSGEHGASERAQSVERPKGV